MTVNSARIDELISEYAEGWTLARMPAVDRNVLRLGVYELLWAPDVPNGVAISEAVLLARDLSTDASPAFVNGLLARIADLKPTLVSPSTVASPTLVSPSTASSPSISSPSTASSPSTSPDGSEPPSEPS